jgi:cell wall-associated NlpC family hydrolase
MRGHRGESEPSLFLQWPMRMVSRPGLVTEAGARRPRLLKIDQRIVVDRVLEPPRTDTSPRSVVLMITRIVQTPSPAACSGTPAPDPVPDSPAPAATAATATATAPATTANRAGIPCRCRPTTPSRPTPRPRWPPPSSGPSANSVPPTTSTVTAPLRTPATRPTSAAAPALVQPAYRAAGITIPRTTSEQIVAGTAVTDVNQIQPGDLLFIPGSKGSPEHPGHVGLAIGDGLLIQAPHTGDVVKIIKVSQ